MTTAATSQTTEQPATRLVYKTVELPHRFAAEVLERCALSTPPTVVSDHPPAVEEWVTPLTQLVTHPDSLPDRETLKHSRTTQVFRARLPLGGGPIEVICKQTRGKGPLSRLADRLTGSRERENMRRACALLRAGISTALPLALVERTSAPREAWLVTEAIPKAVDLDQVILVQLPQLPRRAAYEAKKALIDIAQLNGNKENTTYFISLFHRHCYRKNRLSHSFLL